MGRVKRDLDDVKQRAIGVSKRILAIGAAAAAAGAGFAVKLAADAETAQVQFKVLLGSVEDAKRLMEDLNRLSAATPFLPEDFRKAAKTLLAFGVELDDVISRLQMLGDVASVGSGTLNEFAIIFGKIRGKGKATMEELSQLIERQVNLLPILADQFGVTQAELSKMISKGEVGFPAILAALKQMTSEGGIAFKGMEEKSKTLQGVWSTLVGEVKLLGEAIGSKLVPILSDWVQTATKLVKALNRINTETVRNIIKVTAFATALGAIAIAIAKVIKAAMLLRAAWIAVAKSQAIVLALSGPPGWIALAAGLAAGAAAVWGINKLLSDTAEQKTKIVEETEKATRKTKEELEAARKLREEKQKAAEAAQKAAEAAQKAAEAEQRRIQMLAQQITRAFETPEQKFARQVAELKSLFGLIDPGTAHRAMQAYKSELAEALKLTEKQREQFDRMLATQERMRHDPVGAAVRGTTSGFEAAGRGRAAMQKQIELERQQLRVQQRIEAGIREQITKQGDPIVLKRERL